MKDKLRAAFALIKETFQEWRDDKASRLAAALTYYTIFSLAPLLLIVISLVGLLVNPADVRGRIVNQVRDLVGKDGADMVVTMIDNASRSNASGIAAIIGVVTLLLGAVGVFNALRDALNTIWEVEPAKTHGIVGMIKSRLAPFALIPAVGFLLLVSLVVDTALSVGRSYLGDLLPSVVYATALQILGLVVSFLIITFLFATIYKFLPDTDIAWSDVWIGAAVTALLFSVGRFAIGLYLGHSSTASTYGAAGSLIILLLWIYYSAQILFLGAEFTQVYARRYGTHFGREEGPQPSDEARALRPRAAQPDRQAAPTPRPAPVQVVRPRADVIEKPTPKGYALSGIVAFLLGVLLMGWRK